VLEATMPSTRGIAEIDRSPDAIACAQAVLDAYTDALKSNTTRRRAFDAAVQVWREHNPMASPEMGPPAVASIICRKI
jgi:hypothetical protein